jgi:hypothetical protein
MNYDFFLFSKLHEIKNQSEIEYDLLFEIVCESFQEWEKWDEINGKNIGTYESMQKFISNN